MNYRHITYELPKQFKAKYFGIEEQMLFAHFCDSMAYQRPSVHDSVHNELTVSYVSLSYCP